MRVRQEFEGERKFLGGCIHSGDEDYNPFSVNSCASSAVDHFNIPLRQITKPVLSGKNKCPAKKVSLRFWDELHFKEASLRKLKENLEDERSKLSEDEARLNLKERELSACADWLDSHCQHSTSNFSQNSPFHTTVPNYGGESHSHDQISPQLLRRPRFSSFKPPQLGFRHCPESQNLTRRILRATLLEKLLSHRRRYDGDDAPRRDGFHHSHLGHTKAEH